jgi:outer membrane biogenesis lipoprotein LolB
MLFGGLKMRLKLLMLSTLLLTGCASTMPTSVTNRSACIVWKDISWSQKDTDQTILEVKENNARRNGWCNTR